MPKLGKSAVKLTKFEGIHCDDHPIGEGEMKYDKIDLMFAAIIGALTGAFVVWALSVYLG